MSRFHVITLFPEMIQSHFEHGVVGQALKKGRISLQTTNPREFATDVHKTVDDRPFGGGDGMVMLAQPLIDSIEKATALSEKQAIPKNRRRVIYLSPHGRRLTDQVVRELGDYQELVLVCGRYGGIDQRVINSHIDEEISLGDFVLSGGEIAALAVIDSVSRWVPNVLGNEQSAQKESFASGLLEHPQFTRPRELNGQVVPEVLLSGNHAKISEFQQDLALMVTVLRRPELISALGVDKKRLKAAFQRYSDLSLEEKQAIGVKDEDLLNLIME